jgi:hypothetical protein
MGNERADEAAKNTLEEDINDRELYSPQDLTNWLKNTDARNRQKWWAQGEKTMRFRKETIEWKDDSTNLIRRATHRHVTEKTPSANALSVG